MLPSAPPRRTAQSTSFSERRPPCLRSKSSRRCTPRSAATIVRAVRADWIPATSWNEAESSSSADRNPYIGPQAVGEGVFGRLLAAVDNFSAVPTTFIDGGDHVVVLGRYGGKVKASGAVLDSQFCHVYRFRDGKAVTFQQDTDSAQWARLMA